MSTKKLLVTGATGKQGGALITALLAAPPGPDGRGGAFQIYALTRRANGASARALASRGVHIVEGDMLDPGPIFSRIGADLWGVFCVTVPGATEEQQARGIIDAAVEAGVRHFVYTSVDRGGPAVSPTNPTAIPHFVSKHNVEKYLEDKAASSPQQMTWTILRPTAFYDNLTPDFMGRVFARAMQQMEPKRLQLISARDIGRTAARVFSSRSLERYAGVGISLAGDELNFGEMKRIFEEEVGYQMPLATGWIVSAIKWAVADFGIMFGWFETDGYGVDVEGLRREDPELEDFRTWLRNESKFQTRE
jgi:uncharacterized protein YbjT (DUF2867 family)